jgi:hypothetical protein
VLHLCQQQFLLSQQLLQHTICRSTLRNVIDGQEQGRMAVVLIENFASVEEHDAMSNLRKRVLDLVVLQHGIVGRDLLQLRAQTRNVPLAITYLAKQPAVRLLAICTESQVEGAASRDYAQILVEHEKWFAHRVDNCLRQ